MSIANDTDQILEPGNQLSEVITVFRNTLTYDDRGTASDSWALIATVNATIDFLHGDNPTVDLGQARGSTHRLFLPNATAVRQGDRIRPSGWTTGDNEYEIDAVLSDAGHVEVLASQVRGHA